MCLVFVSDDYQKYLIVCTPMSVSSSNIPDTLQEELFYFLNIISANFPTKGKTYSIENAPDWNPLMFLPYKTDDNASFYTWVDPTSNNTIKYIQFNNPNGALQVPYSFFEKFSETLVGSINTANQNTNIPAIPQTIIPDIYYNQNVPISNIITRYVTKKETVPLLQEMIVSKKNTKEPNTEYDKESNKESNKKSDKKYDKESNTKDTVKTNKNKTDKNKNTKDIINKSKNDTSLNTSNSAPKSKLKKILIIVSIILGIIGLFVLVVKLNVTIVKKVYNYFFKLFGYELPLNTVNNLVNTSTNLNLPIPVKT